jgi:hypothetical protein
MKLSRIISIYEEKSLTIIIDLSLMYHAHKHKHTQQSILFSNRFLKAFVI